MKFVYSFDSTKPFMKSSWRKIVVSNFHQKICYQFYRRALSHSHIVYTSSFIWNNYYDSRGVRARGYRNSSRAYVFKFYITMQNTSQIMYSSQAIRCQASTSFPTNVTFSLLLTEVFFSSSSFFSPSSI